MSSMVYLIGAGPGDPELITLRGIHCLESVECVIYDYLVNQDLLHYCKTGVEKIYVGKKGGQDHISQKEINDLVLERANEGKSVARLKGGDPFVFGRGGEEAEVLAKAGYTIRNCSWNLCRFRSTDLCWNPFNSSGLESHGCICNCASGLHPSNIYHRL